MDGQSSCLFITYVEKEGPFLKVWGQTDKNTSLYVEQVLHSFISQFDNGLCIPHQESLQIGILCCAKYKDNKYYRARITSLDFLHNRYIEVNFIDYGHKDIVPISNIRSLEGFDTSFISIQPQAHSFVVAEAVCPRGEWIDVYLEEICKEIRYNEVNFTIVGQVAKHYLVRLFSGANDVALILISKGLMRHTALSTQEAVLLSMMPRTGGPQPTSSQQNIATYKAFTLESGLQYEVYVSYVTDGPCNFSIQLKQSEEVLAKLMKEINSMTLTSIEGIPLPGTVCLARCMEDAHICRAVVTSEVDGHYKVFYVDFGNFEIVSLDALYEIPFKFVIPKVMAIRFALAGVEKSTVTLEMQCAFKQFVDNRLIHMKVMPMTARTSLPRCELWDPETQTSALDIVNRAASAAYPDHISLSRGFSQLVKVSYVFSCNRFYVQLKSKQDELLKLMLDIQSLCRDVDVLANNMIKRDKPCYALYEGDQQWYRSQIVEVLGGGQVKVQYVDYGNEEVVSISLLKPIEGRQLTVLRPQAIECCLNGYQNMEPDTERDNLLEELILEQEFTMKVVEMQGKKALIELIDSASYNVASLLLDKIAVTRSQVSPMLVQAGNKIEHRKSSQPYSSTDQQHRPERDSRQHVDSSNDNTSWRQDKGSRNKNSYDLNESNENSWRQNNKGFNKNYDRNKRDNDLNDSTDSEKHSAKNFGKDDRSRNYGNKGNSESGSWKQNTRGFNNNQDRFNKDSNRNDWGSREGKKTPRDKHDWGDTMDNKRENLHDKDDWKNSNTTNEDDWGGSTQDDTKQLNKGRQDRWSGGRDTDRSNFNSKKDDWGSSNDHDSKPFHQREKRGRDNWGNKNDNKRNFKSKGDDWENTQDKQEKDSWGNKDGRNDRDNFKSNRNRSGEPNDEWNSTESNQRGGFKKISDFRREASELSSSGSEKSFQKGYGKDNRHKSNFTKGIDKSKNFGGNSGGGGDSWDVTKSPSIEIPNAAPSTAKYTPLNLDGTESNVVISWFHNPAYFYCQIESTQNEFKELMNDIQQAYKGRSPSTAAVGAPVIGLFPEDNVLYRAEVLEVIGTEFKVYYVDFGNVSVIKKVWPIEMRFMDLPAQAICCKLNGIEPPGENWPDASNYSIHFDKKQFFCRFVSTETDRTAVHLESNNEDIASCLLRDGLAVATKPIDPPELPLLIGQQFKAMLVSVNSLADFSISLQMGFIINCGIFNLSASTQTWEDNLKEQLEQIIIVYVDDLKDDKLEVTLYDQNGTKIKLIDRDEEAFETVEILCQYLILYSTLCGEVSHVCENTVFIQPSDCSQIIEYLVNTCFEYYENAPVEPVTPVEGYVYCVKGSDANWYRGRVTKIEENQVTVSYVDYGNEEQLEISALRELILQFMEFPILCVGVTIKDAVEDLIGQTIRVSLKFTESGLEGTIQEEELCVVSADDAQIPITHSEKTESVQLVSEATESVLPVSEENEVIQSSMEAVAPPGTLVILSHTDSPSDFYLQLAESLETIDELQAALQDQIPEMPDMDNPVIGVLCAAPYSLDQQWYRAQVLDADADITTVRFVDYGNTDVLDNHTTRVKTLSPNLLALEVHATRCRLKIKPTDEEWTSAASERFDVLCNVEALTALFISQDEKTNYVELFSNGINVREVLIQENLALPDEVLAETSSVGFVSHLNSPSEFWIQLENCVDELEWVAEQLSGAENFNELEDLAPGALCAALFPDDQMWYRARILSNTVAGIEVLFVDYGNSCTSCSLRELPEDLVMVPPLAQKCSLQKPDKLTNWGPQLVKKFSDISADGQTTFNVNKLSTGETALVELLLDGVNVTTLLLPKTENVRVKEFQSLDDITLIKDDDQVLEKFKLETLPEITWNHESIKKFQEISENGNTIFQAEFVSNDTVRLYLDFNDIRLDLPGTKTITPTSSPMKIRPEKTYVDTVTGDINEIQFMVEGLIDSAVIQHEDKDFMENLMLDIVNTVTNPSQNTNNVDEGGTNYCKITSSNSSETAVVHEDVTLSNITDIGDDQDIKSMVEGVVDAATINNHHDNIKFVEGVLNDVIDSITNSSHSICTNLLKEGHDFTNDVGDYATATNPEEVALIAISVTESKPSHPDTKTEYELSEKTFGESLITDVVEDVIVDEPECNDENCHGLAPFVSTDIISQCTGHAESYNNSALCTASTIIDDNLVHNLQMDTSKKSCATESFKDQKTNVSLELAMNLVDDILEQSILQTKIVDPEINESPNKVLSHQLCIDNPAIDLVLNPIQDFDDLQELDSTQQCIIFNKHNKVAFVPEDSNDIDLRVKCEEKKESTKTEDIISIKSGGDETEENVDHMNNVTPVAFVPEDSNDIDLREKCEEKKESTKTEDIISIKSGGDETEENVDHMNNVTPDVAGSFIIEDNVEPLSKDSFPELNTSNDTNASYETIQSSEDPVLIIKDEEVTSTKLDCGENEQKTSEDKVTQDSVSCGEDEKTLADITPDLKTQTKKGESPNEPAQENHNLITAITLESEDAPEKVVLVDSNSELKQENEYVSRTDNLSDP